MRSLILAAVVVVGAALCLAYDNGMGAKPIMGVNTWCVDDICGIIDKCSAAEVMSMADALVANDSELLKLGYHLVAMDDCWSATNRSETGELQSDPSRFPQGMKALADYVHAKGLLLGVYTCIGTQTCRGGRPGSYGHYRQDAQTLASWGVDFVKIDNCHRPSNESDQDLYTEFSRELNATGRPMWVNLCNWGDDDVLSWGAKISQSYRIQMDHIPLWYTGPWAAGAGYGQGTLNIVNYMSQLNPSKHVERYGWLDPDFLEPLFPITMGFVESRAEFSFWTLWSSPLVVATDVRNMSAKMREIVTNTEAIAINQDELVTAGEMIFNGTSYEQVWARPLHNGDVAVLLFNANPGLGGSGTNVTVSVDWRSLGWKPDTQVAIRDIWQRADLGVREQGFNASLQAHDIRYLRLTPSSTP